jgi:hypothetical protein
MRLGFRQRNARRGDGSVDNRVGDERFEMRRQMAIPAVVAGGLLLAGTVMAQPYDPAGRAITGGLIGAGTGAAIGAIAGGGHGAGVGAAVGGGLGALAGVATTPPPPPRTAYRHRYHRVHHPYYSGY